MATTTLNPSEISELIKTRIEKVKLSAEARNEGVVTSVADGIVRIPFNPDLQRQVLSAAEAIRRARTAPDVRRQHNDVARCRRCPYRQACGPDALGEPQTER